MNTITNIDQFVPSHSLNKDEIQDILLEMHNLYGITSLKVDKDSVRIEYYQELLSSDLIKVTLVKAGFPLEQKKYKPGAFYKLILKLGEENNKEFGGKPPKCCSQH